MDTSDDGPVEGSLGGVVVTSPVPSDAVSTTLDVQALRARWGLDAAPTAHQMQKDRVRAARRERIRVTLKGTPREYVCGLMRHTPPMAWERSLREISPISESHSFLMFAWKCPPDDDRKGRWCLYDCVPKALIPTGQRMLLEGEPYWELPDHRRMGREQMVSAYQWEMYQRHQVWARPFWIVQGEQGGTPALYTALESRLLQMQRLPMQPPGIGALSFAPWDERAKQAVWARDRLVKVAHRIEDLRKSATSEAMIAETEVMEREVRKAQLAWWADQLQEETEFLLWYTRRTEADRTLRKQTRAEMIAAQRMQDEYVETGVIPAAIGH